jgi:choline dehydrogenase-like flavoprotein
MIADLRSDVLPESLDTDVCVVGAGPVGITLAVELSRRGLDVVLLESGGRSIDPALQDLYRSTNVGRNHNGINLGRYRAFGGTSTQWGGQILPFGRMDFKRRDWVEGSGWPITFDDLEPYYLKALSFEGLDGCLIDDPQVWTAIGLSSPAYEAGVVSHFSRWCPQPDFAKIHGKEIEGSASLRCILYATVTALSCVNDRIVTAYARTLTGKSIRVKASRFAFCVGGIESARLLLQRLEDQTPPPWTMRSDALGRFFQDHPTFECADIKPRNAAALHRLMDMIYFGGFKYQPRLYLSATRQRELRSLNAGGIVLFKTEIAAQVLHQVRVAASRLLRGPLSAGAVAEAVRSGVRAGPLVAKLAWRYLVHKRAFNPSDRGYRLLAFVEQAPNPESRLTLSDDTDAFGMRRAQLDWRVGQAEVDTLEGFARNVKTAFERFGLADVDIDPLVAARDPAVLDRTWDNYHNMGTARMADGPEGGVVDRSLRIFGSSNGYVCSTAVFPTGSFSNPTHTAIALALRLADDLCSERTA